MLESNEDEEGPDLRGNRGVKPWKQNAIPMSGGRVAAAHAGWRGLAGGVLESTVDALNGAPGELMAWLGPAIGPSGPRTTP